MNIALNNKVSSLRIKEYLASSSVIDCSHPSIKGLASQLSNGCNSQTGIAKKCFEWVRDEIKHSYDYKLNPVTCKASDVLHYRTGYYYAKSHLLAALLRANNIPAELCYQRLKIEEGGGEFYCLHGLTTVYLSECGWYRVDPRGNKPGVDAQFCPPTEKLAFFIKGKTETDLPGIWAEPLDSVVDVLTKYKTYEDVYYNLPDVKL
ncbi:MAG: transglutaminase family protein [Bacteroidota bacterium]|jgi:transglutaminase-like putative cysteine protease